MVPYACASTNQIHVGGKKRHTKIKKEFQGGGGGPVMRKNRQRNEKKTAQ